MSAQVTLIEEAMREGLQIESADIPVGAKVELLNALSTTGLRYIIVGSFVSPRWVPQMRDIDELIDRFTPTQDVEYRAFALNERGRERYQRHCPPLTLPPRQARTIVHLCDVFVRRNTNRSQAEEIGQWPLSVTRAVEQGLTEARVSVNAAWGSNWAGRFTQGQRMEMLERQVDLWDQAGIPVTEVFLGDPMGWNNPTAVKDQLVAIRSRWPTVKTFHLHLHDTRGMALASAYAAFATLDDTCHLVLDCCIGGMGGCPYCGNGRAAGLLCTEDLVQMLEAEGVDTGVNLQRLTEVVSLAETVVGHPLCGHTSRSGPLPTDASRRYPLDMPLIESLEQAKHFLLGPAAYAGATAPWTDGPQPGGQAARA